jgi:hypothetical protein
MRILVKGGLGNQMFQYALYLAMKKNGKNPKLDISLYRTTEMHNGFELNRIFGINLSEKELVNSKTSNIMFRAISKYQINYFELIDTLKYNPEVFTSSKLYIDGYWQSEQYFNEISREVKQAFSFNNIDSANLSIAKDMLNCEAVSVHIRRGDYINTAYENICDAEYYKRAMTFICSKVNNPVFYIFSDNSEEAKSIINEFSVNYKIVNINSGKDSYKDMYLMTQCRHNIIANSSFSWWGAWLNKSRDKIVVAPKWIPDFNCKTWNIIETANSGTINLELLK